MGHPDFVERLAEEVADGTPVDWVAALSSGAGQDGDTVEQLRILERIAQLHEPAAERASDAAGPVDPLFRWQTLNVLERVGAGSFGEVFRAWDTSLHREVALKLLRQPVTTDPSAADAVLREGQLLARVRHPNVMAVYGAQRHDGVVGIWGEFLRGRTLAEHVGRDGPLSASEAALYGEAVCSALSAVHRAGLLHRDVKAQNVMREAGGRIVLMDFGLGRELASDGPPADGPDLAGTPAYLAPEVFAGKPASVRSDLYAVGVLLFYMVTGEFPVRAPSVSRLAAAHRDQRPAHLQDLRADLPVQFVRVVERALAPAPEDRFASAGALQAALAPLIGSTITDPPPADWRRLAVLALLGLAAIAGVVSTLVWGPPSPAQAAPFALSLAPPKGLAFTEGGRNVPVLSPDGQRVAFIATDPAGGSRVYIRALGNMAAVAVAGSEGASYPFWAPDGQSIAFFSTQGLHRSTLSGARSSPIVRVWESRGGSWGPGDVLLFADGPRSGLSKVPGTGGQAEPVTRVDGPRGEQAHMWPQFLPDGSFIFFVLSEDEDVRGVYRGHLDGRTARLMPSDASALFADGHLFFLRDAALYAQPFDLERNALSGEPVQVAADVNTTYTGRPLVSVSDTGTLLFGTRDRDFRRVAWYGLDGRELETLDTERYRNPSLSRDGRYLALEWYGATSRVRVFDLVRGGWTTMNASIREQLPIFGPGHQLVLSLGTRGHLDLFSLDATQRSQPRLIVEGAYDKQATDWSADGRLVLYNFVGERGNYDVWVTAPDGSNARPLLDSPAQEVEARFSPDGRAVAYASNESGRMEIYTRTPWESGAPIRVSTSGGYDPVWRTDTELLYLDPRGTLFASPVPDGPGRAPHRPLFKTGVNTPGTSRNHYAVAPGGQRVLIVSPVQDPSASHFTVLAPWRRAALE